MCVEFIYMYIMHMSAVQLAAIKKISIYSKKISIYRTNILNQFNNKKL